MKNIEGLV